MGAFERLKSFHEHLKSNGYGGRNAFEREIGVSEGYLSKKAKGIGSDIMEKISERFPELSIEWLVTGRGSMFIQEQESYDSAINEQNEELIEKLQSELKEAYTEIGRLNMELNKLKAI